MLRLIFAAFAFEARVAGMAVLKNNDGCVGCVVVVVQLEKEVASQANLENKKYAD